VTSTDPRDAPTMPKSDEGRFALVVAAGAQERDRQAQAEAQALIDALPERERDRVIEMVKHLDG
jgi:hypothetical protein